MLSAVGRFNDELEADDEDLSDDEKEIVRKSLQTIFGLTLSVMANIRCLLIFGSYLNDLVAQVRAGGPDADKALLRAIKIDPTVLGCPSVVQRLSRAAIESDKRFFSNVKGAVWPADKERTGELSEDALGFAGTPRKWDRSP